MFLCSAPGFGLSVGRTERRDLLRIVYRMSPKPRILTLPVSTLSGGNTVDCYVFWVGIVLTVSLRSRSVVYRNEKKKEQVRFFLMSHC